MSFKETILPDFVIAALYPDSLSGELREKEGMPGLTTDKVSGITAGGMPSTRLEQEPGMLPAEPVTATSLADLPYRFLGKNQRKVSVIARYPEDPYIPEDHLQFLIKILAACKLNLGDVAILNDAVSAISIAKLKRELAPAFVLLFDIDPTGIGLPLSFPALKPQLFDGTNYLLIPPIVQMLEDNDQAKALKKQLWESLKKMFAV